MVISRIYICVLDLLNIYILFKQVNLRKIFDVVFVNIKDKNIFSHLEHLQTLHFEILYFVFMRDLRQHGLLINLGASCNVHIAFSVFHLRSIIQRLPSLYPRFLSSLLSEQDLIFQLLFILNYFLHKICLVLLLNFGKIILLHI